MDTESTYSILRARGGCFNVSRFAVVCYVALDNCKTYFTSVCGGGEKIDMKCIGLAQGARGHGNHDIQSLDKAGGGDLPVEAEQ